MNKQTVEVLNKLLYSNIVENMEPLKLEELCNQIKELPIDNVECLQNIVDLIYDEAVNEPNFSKTAALITRELTGIKVSANNPDNPHKTFNFLEFIMQRSEMDFEKNWKNGKPFYRRLKDLVDKCTNLEAKKQLLLMIQKEKRRFKIKALGNIRFIGELFKLSILKPKIIMYCMLNLLKIKDECSLECLCELLTAIGKQLESTLNISKFFIELQEILDKQSEEIGSYTSGMLQDVIQLWNSNWVTCNTPDQEAEDVNKTQEESYDEAQSKMDTNGKHIGCDYQRSNNQPNNNSKDVRRSCNVFENSKGSVVDPLRLPPTENITLGSKSLFEQWAQGSNVKTHMATYSVKSHPPMMTNMYTAPQIFKLYQNKRPIFSPKNKTPMFFPNCKTHMFSPKNKTPMFSPKNKTPIFFPKNKTPMFSPKNKTPMFSPKNKTPMFFPKNKTPMFSPKNNTPMFFPKNKTPMFSSKNNTPMFCPKNKKSILNGVKKEHESSQ